VTAGPDRTTGPVDDSSGVNDTSGFAMMKVAILQFSMQIPSSFSLKDKRRVVNALKEKIRAKYNVSIAEIENQDQWDVATFGVAMAGSDARYVNGAMDKLLETLAGWPEAELMDHQLEIL
jgi:uncharacterized protein YlxP (DUF503 family)